MNAKYKYFLEWLLTLSKEETDNFEYRLSKVKFTYKGEQLTFQDFDKIATEKREIYQDEIEYLRQCAQTHIKQRKDLQKYKQTTREKKIANKYVTFKPNNNTVKDLCIGEYIFIIKTNKHNGVETEIVFCVPWSSLHYEKTILTHNLDLQQIFQESTIMRLSQGKKQNACTRLMGMKQKRLPLLMTSLCDSSDGYRLKHILKWENKNDLRSEFDLDFKNNKSLFNQVFQLWVKRDSKKVKSTQGYLDSRINNQYKAYLRKRKIIYS